MAWHMKTQWQRLRWLAIVVLHKARTAANALLSMSNQLNEQLMN
jgi:hypothetical protein